jgi:abelson tyrosine-protein kinase 1
VTLPLWTPSPIRLGAVGYLSKPDGRFVTLLNCFDGTRTGRVAFPPMSDLGKVDTFSARNEKRSAALRGFDIIRNLVGGVRYVAVCAYTSSLS